MCIRDRLAPEHGARLVMPRLGEAVEPARVEGVTPWWRDAGRPVRGAAPPRELPITVARSVPWPID